ncbi:MAG TPA: RHS repeat-associated core domain-containing protein, partial [Ktedonobacteraceae bacterium]
GVWSGSNCVNGYDANGNLLAKTDARGITTSYTYDALNRLIGKQHFDATLSACYRYDTPTFGPLTTGRLTSEWTQPGTCSWGTQGPTNAKTYSQTLGYDPMGRSLGDMRCIVNCQGTTAQMFVMKYGYDLAGNRTSLIDPFSITYTSSYDGAGRLSSVTNTNAQATLFSATSYGPVGLLNSKLGNGLLEARSYDNRLRPLTYNVSSPNAPVSSTPPTGSVSAPYNDASQTNVVAQGDTLHVQGWAASPNAGCPIAAVDVELGATRGGVGTPIGNATLGFTGWLYTPGFLTCGFSFDDSVGDIAPGQYYVNVYGIDASGQRGLLTNQYPITVTDGTPPYGNVDWVQPVVPDGGSSTVASGGKITLSGWAIDSQMVAPVAAVKVSVDGNDIGFAKLGVQRPDVVSIIGNGNSRYLNSGFTFTGTIGNLSPGQHSVAVTIYDALGQHTTPASIYPITVASDPSVLQGNMDSTNASANNTISSGATLTASGWAAYPAASNCGVGQTVELWLGSTLIGQTQTSGPRQDVANALGNQACLNTGWSISGSIAGVPAGIHALVVRVYDAVGGSYILNSVPQIMVSPQGSSTVSVATSLPTQYSWSLGYAPNGNVDYAYDSVNGNWAYLYDNLNRLVGAGSANGNGLAWVYDSFGNMSSQTVTGGVGYGIEKTFAGADNRMTNSCYDAAGNQLQDWGCYSPSQYAYDAENRLTSSGWGATGYLYDAEGQRVAKYSDNTLTNVYIHDAEGHNIAELNASGGLIRRDVYARNRHLATYNDAAGGAINYALGDWLGTERARSDVNGALCQTTTSQPFGDGQQSSGTCSPSNHFFTGLERDQESGLDHAQFRQYSSTMGRWMSPDPYNGSMDINYPQTFNRYAYVGNMPLGFTDPSGLVRTCNGTPADTDGPCKNQQGDSGEWWDPVDWPSKIFSLFTGGPKINPNWNAKRPINVGCSSLLPNGQTVGDVVRQQRALLQNVANNAVARANTGTPSNPLGEITGAFYPIAKSNGPIDFKKTFSGQANGVFLGQAGNFAYYAIGSGILPNLELDAGAGAYALYSAALGRKPFSSLTGPMFSDASAASTRDAGLAANGCAQ